MNQTWVTVHMTGPVVLHLITGTFRFPPPICRFPFSFAASEFNAREVERSAATVEPLFKSQSLKNFSHFFCAPLCQSDAGRIGMTRFGVQMLSEDKSHIIGNN